LEKQQYYSEKVFAIGYRSAVIRALGKVILKMIAGFLIFLENRSAGEISSG